MGLSCLFIHPFGYDEQTHCKNPSQQHVRENGCGRRNPIEVKTCSEHVPQKYQTITNQAAVLGGMRI